MSEAVDRAEHDFWRPPMPVAKAVANPERNSTCRCGTEFIVSSLYCHSCGARRPDLNAARMLEIPGGAELAWLGARLALPTPALIAFLLGLLFVAGSAAVCGVLSLPPSPSAARH